MLLFFVFFLAFLCAGVLWKMPVIIKYEICGRVIYIRIELRCFFALLPLSWEKQLEIKNIVTVINVIRTHPAVRAFIEKRKRKKHRVFRLDDGLRLIRINCEGRIGIEHDAYHTVMLIAAIDILGNGLAVAKDFLFYNALRPEFSKGECRLKLESILELSITQIIIAAYKRKKIKIRG